MKSLRPVHIIDLVSVGINERRAAAPVIVLIADLLAVRVQDGHKISASVVLILGSAFRAFRYGQTTQLVILVADEITKHLALYQNAISRLLLSNLS